MCQLSKRVLSIILAVGFAYSCYAQDDDLQAFRENQLSSSHVSTAMSKYNDSLRNMFTRKGLEWPPKDVYLRAFKSQNEMEVWARNDEQSEYKFVKTYQICALSGILGPKRWEGDRQVPEGYYFIDHFNANSDFYLSLLLNYPNYSDMVLAYDKQNPGGNIYIHGGCVTIGCMPMTDDVIEQLYVICLDAKLNGETYIPVHIYPVRFTKAGLNFLGRTYASDQSKQQFWVDLKTGYDYFEKNHKLLPVMYTPEGKYVN